MRQFGRTLDTTGLAPGGLIQLEGPHQLKYPTISPQSMVNANEKMMFQQGAINNPPVRPIFTQNASGGCIPVCAAEISAGRKVDWIYLMHQHGGNNPLNIAAAATNPNNVYVCLMVFSGASSLWAAENMQDSIFEALDPNDDIPQANALLIFGNHTRLVITRQAMVAVDVV